MIESKELTAILRGFNTSGYADATMSSETAKYLSNGKNGLLLRANSGEFSYEDEFYGGQPYSGNETIWENGVPIFRCVYWGKFLLDIPETFLREALSVGPSGKCVHRGPESFVKGGLEYRNECVGTIEEFHQIERIYKDGIEAYIAHFYGGRINIQKV